MTTSLLYFYFKSKDLLVLATARAIAEDVDASLADLENPSQFASAVGRALALRPAFARLLAWLVLEGRGIAELSGDPVLARLFAAFDRAGSPDPVTDGAAAATLLLGTSLLGPAMNEVIGRSPDDERLLHALDRSLGGASSL